MKNRNDRNSADYSDRKIVFFDIDGTLLDNATHRIPESAVESIRRLRGQRAPGLHQFGTDAQQHPRRDSDIGFDGMVCGCGTHIYYRGETLFSHTIPHEKCVEIVRRLRELKITAFFESPEYVWFDGQHPVKNPEVEQSKTAFRKTDPMCRTSPDLEGSGLTFDKFYCLLTAESDREDWRNTFGENSWPLLRRRPAGGRAGRLHESGRNPFPAERIRDTDGKLLCHRGRGKRYSHVPGRGKRHRHGRVRGENSALLRLADPPGFLRMELKRPWNISG